MNKQKQLDYDYVIVGSGFGGSVSALRLSEKGYKVLVIEKGKWLKANDFPKTNWNLRKWLWLPSFRFFGLFKMTFFHHVGVLSGVGVGGGSLVYANTLPIPKKQFFNTGSWARLADWETELAPHYKTALEMLGAVRNPNLYVGDEALRTIAKDIGKEHEFRPTNVAVYFGQPGKTVSDPYFDGKGPDRTGCIHCGGCMLGCRYNAKNTLDKNYLHLAQQLGTKIIAESEVYDILSIGKEDGSDGYEISYRSSTTFFKRKSKVRSQGVVFSGGVMGTVPLLTRLKPNSLPRLSNMVGKDVRTNNESLIGVTTFDKKTNFSEGVAIGSILNTDENSHLEPVRYSKGSGFWRFMMAPMVTGKTVFGRLLRIIRDVVVHPWDNLRILFTDDFSKRSQILLFMQHLDSTITLSKGIFGLKTKIAKGDKPSAFIPEAQELANKYSKIVNGKPMVLVSESLLGIPTTAHILGGAVIGKDPS